MTPKELAEKVFADWEEAGTLETTWMNPVDKEPFIGSIESAIRFHTSELMDAVERAWGLIANAYDGNWDLANRDWREAAEQWISDYQKVLDDNLQDNQE